MDFEVRFRLHTDVTPETKTKWHCIQNSFQNGCDRSILRECSELVMSNPKCPLQDCKVLTCAEGGLGEMPPSYNRQLLNITKTLDNIKNDYGEILFRAMSSEDKVDNWKLFHLKHVAQSMKTVLENKLGTCDESVVEFLISVDMGMSSDCDSNSTSATENDICLEQFLF